MIKIAAYQGVSGVSRVIKWITSSRYSHVAFVLPDNSVVEAWDSGLRKVGNISIQHNVNTKVDIFLLNLSTVQERQLLKLIEKDLANPPKYDFYQVLHFLPVVRLFARSQPDNARFFCSEYIVDRLNRVGYALFNNTLPCEVPPDWIARSLKTFYSHSEITS